MRKFLSLFIPVFLLLTGSVFAQPSNDVCSSATLLTVAADTTCTPSTHSFADATEESSANTCGAVAASPNAFDTWFKFVANGATQIIDLHPLATGGGFGTGVGAVVELYASCGGSQIACGNPTVFTFGGQTFVQTSNTRVTGSGLSVGVTYFVRVYPYGDTLPAAGRDQFEICVRNAPAPPSNDVCANASTLTVGTSCIPTAGTVGGASQENAPGTCGADPASATAFDVWYKFTANQSNEIITVAPAAAGQGNPAPVIEVYDACAGTQIACANPRIFPGFGAIPGTTTLNSNVFVASNTYWVRVYHYGATAPNNGNFNICVYDAPPAPANDTCSAAVQLTVKDTCEPVTGTVASANQEMAPSACDPDVASATANDVWYKFTATKDEHFIDVAATGGQTGVAAVIELYDVCGGGGTRLNCANPVLIPGFGAIAGTTTMDATDLTPGTEYLIRVYHYGAVAPGNGEFEICVYNPPPPPVNDTCNGAISLTVTATCVNTNGSLADATDELPAENCSGTTSTDATDVWYSFEATNTDAVVEANSQAFGAVLNVYDACGGTNIGCANPPAQGATVLTLTGLTVGQTYFVRIYPDAPLAGAGNFTICVHDAPQAPANDDCANATLIAEADSKGQCSPTAATTINATQSTEPTACALNAIDDDIWFKFVATSTDAVASATGKSGNLNMTNIGYTMYKGSCSGTQSTECNQGAMGDSLLFRNLTIGETYYLRVYTRANTQTGTFNICVYKYTAPAAPANDTCGGAITLTATLSDTCTTPKAGNFTGATSQSPADSCNAQKPSTTSNDLWYKFTAVADAHDVEFKSQTVGGVVALYEANGNSCAGLITCQNPRLVTAQGQTFAAPGTTKLKALGLTIGKTYFVRVYGYGNPLGGGATNFTICVFKDSAATGISENVINQTISLYPNPTRDKIELSFSSTSKVQITLLNLNGQVVYTEATSTDGVYDRTIDLSTFAKGIYTLQILSDNENITRKVVKD